MRKISNASCKKNYFAFYLFFKFSVDATCYTKILTCIFIRKNTLLRYINRMSFVATEEKWIVLVVKSTQASKHVFIHTSPFILTDFTLFYTNLILHGELRTTISYFTFISCKFSFASVVKFTFVETCHIFLIVNDTYINQIL